MNNLLTFIIFLSLTACGGGNGDESTSPTNPIAEQPPIQPIDPLPPSEIPQPMEPIEIPPPPPALEPIIVPEPMPIDHFPPVGNNPIPPIVENPSADDPYSHPIAPNRTTVPPTPPVGMYSIYRTELTNSPTPWNEFVGSFYSLDEAEARFKKDGEPLMYGEGYQYMIMTGKPNDIYSFSWPCVCIPR